MSKEEIPHQVRDEDWRVRNLLFFLFRFGTENSFSYAEKKVFLTGKGCFLAKEHILFLTGTHPFPRRSTTFSSQGKKRYESLNIWGKEGGASKVVLKT